MSTVDCYLMLRGFYELFLFKKELNLVELHRAD